MSRFAGRLGLAFFVLGAVFPMLFSIIYALLYSFGLMGIGATGFTTAYWIKLFSQSQVAESFLFSAYISITCAFLSWLIAVALFEGFGDFWLRSPWTTFWFFPLTIPAMVSGFLVLQWLSGGGWLARVAYYFGWISAPQDFPVWTNDPYGIGIIVAHLLTGIPFFLLLFLSIWKEANLAAFDALAASLGAQKWQIRWRVHFPILFNRSKGNVLLYVLAVFGAYDIPLLVGSQTPQMISVLALRKYERFDLSEKPEAFIIALLYTLLLCLIILWKPRNEENP